MKAKKSRGAKNKLYNERNQGRQVSDFLSDFHCNTNIYFHFTDISKQTVTDVRAECEEVS